jgi:hypothetical protein
VADRFVVRSITGYSAGARPKLSTSYWVLDLDCAQVVATFYSGDGNNKGDWREKRRKHAAEARCRYLNEQYRRWLHTGRPMDVGVVS